MPEAEGSSPARPPRGRTSSFDQRVEIGPTRSRARPSASSSTAPAPELLPTPRPARAPPARRSPAGRGARQQRLDRRRDGTRRDRPRPPTARSPAQEPIVDEHGASPRRTAGCPRRPPRCGTPRVKRPRPAGSRSAAPLGRREGLRISVSRSPCGAPSAGRSSRSSGRASSSRIGAPPSVATYSTGRGRSAPPSGRRRRPPPAAAPASVSRSLRTAQKISSAPRRLESPSAAATLADHPGPRAREHAPRAWPRLLADSPRPIPAACLNDLGDGPEGDPLPVGKTAALEHGRPVADASDQLAREARLADARGAQHGREHAATLADRPSNAASSSPSSRWRPTSGESSRRAGPAPGITSSSRKAGTGAACP